MKSYWITHQNKKIFYARYDNLSLEDLQQEMNAAVKEVNQHAPDSVLLLIGIYSPAIGIGKAGTGKSDWIARKALIPFNSAESMTEARAA